VNINKDFFKVVVVVILQE